MVYLPTDGQLVTHPSSNPAVHSRELNSRPVDHKSDALTATPPSSLINVNTAVHMCICRLEMQHVSMTPSLVGGVSNTTITQSSVAVLLVKT